MIAGGGGRASLFANLFRGVARGIVCRREAGTMGKSDYKYGRNGKGAFTWLVLTTVLVGALVFLMNRDADGGGSAGQTLVIY